MCWRKENKVLSFRQHYFCTFVTYNKIQMDINQNYREAVKSIKEAILRSQYRAAASVNKEQLSLYYGIGRYVSENSRTDRKSTRLNSSHMPKSRMPSSA